MAERFYLPQRLEQVTLTLGGPEAHHLLHVLRLGAGAMVILFDGEGTEAEAEIVSVSRRDVLLRPRMVRSVADPVSTSVTLAVAPPKGDRFRWLAEKATELGVARLVPLLTRRTVVDPKEGKLDRLRQTVVAASKQCGRSRLMAIDEPVRFDDLLSRRGSTERVLLLDPSGDPYSAQSIMEDCGGMLLLIGPEGGFTEEEVARARNSGAEVIRLGGTILRTETAAIAAAAISMQAVTGK